MGSVVAGLDATAVNLALPAIRADLGGGLAGQQWVLNAYLLALGARVSLGCARVVILERVPAGARLADPDRRLARRHLRRAPDLLDRRGGLRAHLGAVRGGAQH